MIAYPIWLWAKKATSWTLNPPPQVSHSVLLCFPAFLVTFQQGEFPLISIIALVLIWFLLAFLLIWVTSVLVCTVCLFCLAIISLCLTKKTKNTFQQQITCPIYKYHTLTYDGQCNLYQCTTGFSIWSTSKHKVVNMVTCHCKAIYTVCTVILFF